MSDNATISKAELETMFQRVAGKYGGEKEASLRLTRDNFKYRERIKALERELEAAKSAAPSEGATVLSGDDAKEWEAFKALGKKASEVSASLTKGEEATAKLAGMEWEQGARKAAQAAGITNADAFLLLPGVRDLTFETRTEKEDGKDVERVLYKGKDGEAKTLTRDAIESRADWKPLAAALFTEESADRSTETSTAQGIPFSRQRSERRGGDTKKTDEDHRKAVAGTVSYKL